MQDVRTCANPNCKRRFVPRKQVQKYCSAKCNAIVAAENEYIKRHLNDPEGKPEKKKPESEFYSVEEFRDDLIIQYLTS